ncbi:MAG TPA: RhuM family protein [bacterium]|nr:RhuM family protein [bacterium]
MELKNEKDNIVIYQHDEGISTLQVRLEGETVWLSLEQMSELFRRDKSTVSRHIKNIFKEGELEKNSVIANFATTATDGKTYAVDYYNLDVIISVGYRVKSSRGTQFRIWANQVLKNYLMKGYALNHRIEQIEQKLSEHDKKFELIIQKALPLKEGIFFEGQVFDAYEKVVSFIKEATTSIILIDNYIDETILAMLSKRNSGVKTTIYTAKLTRQLKLDLEKHNAQYEPIEIKVFERSHDRFLIIDEETVYHVGASLKDLGKKWFAFSKISIEPEIILSNLPKL